MSQDRFERRRVDRHQRKRILEYQIKALQAQVRGDGIRAAIRSRQNSQKRDEIIERFVADKKWLLDFIADCSEIFKDKWYRRLQGVTVTDSRADTELTGLLQDVKVALRILEGNPFGLPELYPGVKSPSSVPEPGWMQRESWRGDLSWLGRYGRDWEQRERTREAERRLRETDLRLIKSYLKGLIALRAEYTSFTS